MIRVLGTPVRGGTVTGLLDESLGALGWDETFEAAWRALNVHQRPTRISRIDRGWSSLLRHRDDMAALRVRNIGADVAVGDWVVPSGDHERVDHVLARRSAFVRRASFEGDRAAKHTIAANIDVVMLVHSLTTPPNQRRLERELVLAFDSGATPVVVLSKADLCDDPRQTAASLRAVAPGVAVHVVSGVTTAGVDELRGYAGANGTIALLGASGVGKSTLINALVGERTRHTEDVRFGDQRGRHTTTAAELVPIPAGGWLVDTPGVRAVSLWSSGHGIERAFRDIFEVMDHCRFRDCKHDDEPGCAVRAAVENGTLTPERLDSMKRLVAEEAALEAEQRVQDKALDRRGVRKPRPRH
ncbi:MAG: ribosome small subunit-dependent GTPase A [Ilumatobacteraceae bacterium]|jgi:ribosome biogenesis GTPase